MADYLDYIVEVDSMQDSINDFALSMYNKGLTDGFSKAQTGLIYAIKEVLAKRFCMCETRSQLLYLEICKDIDSIVSSSEKITEILRSSQ